MLEGVPSVVGQANVASLKYAQASEREVELFCDAEEAIEGGDYQRLEDIIEEPDFNITVQNQHGQTLFHLLFSMEYDDSQAVPSKLSQNRRQMLQLLLATQNSTCAMSLVDKENHTFVHTLFEHPSMVNNVLLHEVSQAQPQLIKDLSAWEARNGEALINVGFNALIRIPEKKSLFERFSAKLKAFVITIKISMLHKFGYLDEEEADRAKQIVASMAAEMPLMTWKDKARLLAELGSLIDSMTNPYGHLRQQIHDANGNAIRESLQPSTDEPTLDCDDDEDFEEVASNEVTAEQHRNSFQPIATTGQLEPQVLTYAPVEYLRVNGIVRQDLAFLHEDNHVDEKDFPTFIEQFKAKHQDNPTPQIGLLGIEERYLGPIKLENHTLLIIHVNEKVIIVDSKFTGRYTEADKVIRTGMQSINNHDDCTRYAIATIVELCRTLDHLDDMSSQQKEAAIMQVLQTMNKSSLRHQNVDDYLIPERERKLREHNEVTRQIEQQEQAAKHQEMEAVD
ncbi:hypothetical protein [Parashewanella tropica]|uniref:hypothetical protein n=1 Tax=Parashewanella tropica TaxID=2547970 RepID=UPI00105A44D1|nr:hypothetical protein [Parashewanella tropica]